jgi:hypothetical protein
VQRDLDLADDGHAGRGAAASGGALGGTPGLATTSAARAMRARSCPPVCTSTPSAASAAAAARALAVARVRRVHPVPVARQQLRGRAPALAEADDRDLARGRAAEHAEVHAATAA